MGVIQSFYLSISRTIVEQQYVHVAAISQPLQWF